MAQRYAEGRGVPQDPIKAAEWALGASAIGHAGALEWLAARARSGDAYAELACATVEQMENPAVARDRGLRIIAKLDEAQAAGDAWAAFGLGYAYAFGWIVPKTPATAQVLLTRAADAGLAGAQNALAVMLLDGNGVPKDPKRAAYWYRRAAEKGHPMAQFSVGLDYGVGSGVPKNEKRAFKWYEAAALQGLPAAQWALGMAYLEGRGVAVDIDRARHWLLRAAHQGDARAANALRRIAQTPP